MVCCRQILNQTIGRYVLPTRLYLIFFLRKDDLTYICVQESSITVLRIYFPEIKTPFRGVIEEQVTK